MPVRQIFIAGSGFISHEKRTSPPGATILAPLLIISGQEMPNPFIKWVMEERERPVAIVKRRPLSMAFFIVRAVYSDICPLSSISVPSTSAATSL